MKILWWATVFPLIPSGYGRVSKYMPQELAKLGHQVEVFSSLGHQGGRLSIDGLRLRPNPASGASLGLDFVVRARQELEADLVVYMGDYWPFMSQMQEAVKKLPLVLHSPIDHFPVTELEARVVRKSLALMTFCHWSVDQAQRAKLTNTHYAPHGCQLEIYSPGDKAEARRRLGWDPGWFVYLNVAANVGSRKWQFGLLRAYSMLLDRRPELRRKVRLVLHTYPFRDQNNHSGFDIWNIAAQLRVQTRCVWAQPLSVLEGVPEEQLALMYQAADVQVLPSKTEGFGLTIIEAGACGCPTIATDFGSMTELVGERGWLIRPADYEVQQALGYAWQAIPSTDHLSQLMEHVYDQPEELRRRGQAMMEYVRANFSWEQAAAWWAPVLQELEGRPSWGFARVPRCR